MRGRAHQIVANQVSDKTNNQVETVCIEKKTHTQSDEGSGCVGQMTSCIGVSLLCCRALLSVAGGGGVVSSFSVCTFFVSGGSSHGRTSLGLCLVRPTVLSLSLSQLERTRAVHVTSRLAEQTSEARRGRCRALTDPAYYL